jgi:hypothetical protein
MDRAYELWHKNTSAEQFGGLTVNQSKVCGFWRSQLALDDFPHRREKVLGRAQVLRQSKVEVELFNLTAEGQVFSMEFWGRIIGDPEDDLAGLAPDVQPMRIQVPPHCIPYTSGTCSTRTLLPDLSLLGAGGRARSPFANSTSILSTLTLSVFSPILHFHPLCVGDRSSGCVATSTLS